MRTVVRVPGGQVQTECQPCHWSNIRLHTAQAALWQHVGWQGARVRASGTCTCRTGLRVTKALAWSHRVGSGSACTSVMSGEQLVDVAASTQLQGRQPPAKRMHPQQLMPC